MFRILGNRRLFRRDIEPRCAYCARANAVNEQSMSCRKHGIVPREGSCRAFRYDPLCRIPPKPAVLRGTFTDTDFQLEEYHED